MRDAQEGGWKVVGLVVVIFLLVKFGPWLKYWFWDPANKDDWKSDTDKEE